MAATLSTDDPTVDRQQALDAAMAQIQEAFGKNGKRERYKVWTDRYTEELVWRYIRERVDSVIEDDDGCSPLWGEFWYEVIEDMDRGEHRVLDGHPWDAMLPPQHLSRFGFFVRRIMGWFQRGE